VPQLKSSSFSSVARRVLDLIPENQFFHLSESLHRLRLRLLIWILEQHNPPYKSVQRRKVNKLEKCFVNCLYKHETVNYTTLEKGGACKKAMFCNPQNWQGNYYSTRMAGRQEGKPILPPPKQKKKKSILNTCF
jgi:hypothetical protein